MTDITPQIGPDTPGWAEFWERAHTVADENGMCPEFDRITREMGGVPRPVKVDTVTYDVTVRITVPGVHHKHTANREQIAAALQSRIASEYGFIQERVEIDRLTISTPAN